MRGSTVEGHSYEVRAQYSYCRRRVLLLSHRGDLGQCTSVLYCTSTDYLRGEGATYDVLEGRDDVGARDFLHICATGYCTGTIMLLQQLWPEGTQFCVQRRVKESENPQGITSRFRFTYVITSEVKIRSGNLHGNSLPLLYPLLAASNSFTSSIHSIRSFIPGARNPAQEKSLDLSSTVVLVSATMRCKSDHERERGRDVKHTRAYEMKVHSFVVFESEQ